MTIRPAVLSDFIAFFGEPPPMTVRALTLCDGDEPVVLGGYFLANGGVMAFSEQRKPVRKRDMVRAAHAMNEMLKNVKAAIWATEGEYGTTALKHFGFKPAGEFWRRDL